MSRERSTEREQYLTCINCAHPLSDNQMVKDAYTQNNVVAWAKGRLRVLADVADGMVGGGWFAAQVREINDGLEHLPIPGDSSKAGQK